MLILKAILITLLILILIALFLWSVVLTHGITLILLIGLMIFKVVYDELQDY